MFGTIAEIFDYTSDTPVISEESVKSASRLFYPINLDIYSLFDRKLEGEWHAKPFGNLRANRYSLYCSSVENLFINSRKVIGYSCHRRQWWVNYRGNWIS